MAPVDTPPVPSATGLSPLELDHTATPGGPPSQSPHPSGPSPLESLYDGPESRRSSASPLTADLSALESLYDATLGWEVPLPPELATSYGPLRLPTHPGRPYVISNFVTTLDGVVSLNEPGRSGGGPISGFNQHDRLVMGILRAVADAVVVGAGTLRAVPRHLRTAEYIYPPLADAYRRLRVELGKAAEPLNVIVTARGDLDLDLPVFRSGQVPTLIVATDEGAARLKRADLPPSVRVAAAGDAGAVTPRAILVALAEAGAEGLVLVEGGPRLLGDFLAEGHLDELFLTLAPQVAGRNDTVERPGLVTGHSFAPDRPLWGALTGVKRADSHLFLRYAMPTVDGDQDW